MKWQATKLVIAAAAAAFEKWQIETTTEQEAEAIKWGKKCDFSEYSKARQK